MLGYLAGTDQERVARRAQARSLLDYGSGNIRSVERALELYGAPVYVRKQIVHNIHVVRALEQRGAIFVEEAAEVPEGAVVVFSAHGVAPQVREEAAKRGVKVCNVPGYATQSVAQLVASAQTALRDGRAPLIEGGEAPAVTRRVDRGAPPRLARRDGDGVDG